MTLVSRELNPLQKRESRFRSPRLIIIATEGEVTEKQYFEMRFLRNSKVKLLILETTDGRSAPQYVIERLDEYRKKNELDKDDHMWIVIDRDRWKEKQLINLVENIQKNYYKLALSNPRFELWLLLHHRDVKSDENLKGRNKIEVEIRKLTGEFNKGNLKEEHYMESYQQAILRARILDDNPSESWQKRNGTRVYQVIEDILDL